MNSVDKNIIISTLSKNYNNAKITNKLDNFKVELLDLVNYYMDFSETDYNSEYLILKDILYNLKLDKDICNKRIKLYSYINTDSIPQNGSTVLNPTLENNSVTTVKEKIFENQNFYDVYKFNLNDIKYSDKLDNDFTQLSIDTNDLQDGNIRICFNDDTNCSYYDESSGSITISRSNISYITYYTDSNNIFSHPLNIKTYTEYNGEMIPSNTATLTINRTNLGIGNQPATIGDASVKTNNRVTTVLTLAMFTTGLTPPYNDPENDLIDAIRIDEISTANKGKFYLDSIEIVIGQIITREDLAANLFTHVGPDVNTIETDAFNFSARDEGSQIWIQ